MPTSSQVWILKYKKIAFPLQNLTAPLLLSFLSQSSRLYQRAVSAFLSPPTQQSTHYQAVRHWPLALMAAGTSDRGWGCRSAQWELCGKKQKTRPIKTQLRAFPLGVCHPGLGRQTDSVPCFLLPIKTDPFWLPWTPQKTRRSTSLPIFDEASENLYFTKETRLSVSFSIRLGPGVYPHPLIAASPANESINPFPWAVNS